MTYPTGALLYVGMALISLSVVTYFVLALARHPAKRIASAFAGGISIVYIAFLLLDGLISFRKTTALFLGIAVAVVAGVIAGKSLSKKL